MDHVDCIVVGAGVVGLAIARALARAGSPVLILDAATCLMMGTSGRGSGVIHAGLYYPTGSLKAQLCTAGREALYTFADRYDVPYRKLGKLIVATSAGEDASLAEVGIRAMANGVEDLEPLTSAAAAALEPSLFCTSAYLSPSTGIIDAPSLMRALRDDAEEFGAVTAFHAPVLRVARSATGFLLDVGGAAPMRVSCRVLVNAAGHGAPGLAGRIEGLPRQRVPQAFFAKGTYFTVSGPAPFSRLIYPVPVAGGLGTHLTLDMTGAALFGPDVEWVESLDYALDPTRATRFYADIRRYWPDLPDDALSPVRAGIRPKISGPGEPARDFLIEGEAEHGVVGLVNLFGIESPGLTSCLAIADHVHKLLAV